MLGTIEISRDIVIEAVRPGDQSEATIGVGVRCANFEVPMHLLEKAPGVTSALMAESMADAYLNVLARVFARILKEKRCSAQIQINANRNIRGAVVALNFGDRLRYTCTWISPNITDVDKALNAALKAAPAFTETVLAFTSEAPAEFKAKPVHARDPEWVIVCREALTSEKASSEYY